MQVSPVSYNYALTCKNNQKNSNNYKINARLLSIQSDTFNKCDSNSISFGKKTRKDPSKIGIKVATLCTCATLATGAAGLAIGNITGEARAKEQYLNPKNPPHTITMQLDSTSGNILEQISVQTGVPIEVLQSLNSTNLIKNGNESADIVLPNEYSPLDTVLENLRSELSKVSKDDVKTATKLNNKINLIERKRDLLKEMAFIYTDNDGNICAKLNVNIYAKQAPYIFDDADIIKNNAANNIDDFFHKNTIIVLNECGDNPYIGEDCLNQMEEYIKQANEIQTPVETETNTQTSLITNQPQETQIQEAPKQENKMSFGTIKGNIDGHKKDLCKVYAIKDNNGNITFEIVITEAGTKYQLHGLRSEGKLNIKTGILSEYNKELVEQRKREQGTKNADEIYFKEGDILTFPAKINGKTVFRSRDGQLYKEVKYLIGVDY